MYIVKPVLSLFRPRFNRALVSLLASGAYSLKKYYVRFWHTKDFDSLPDLPDAKVYKFRNESLRTFLDIGGLAQLITGIVLVVLGAQGRVVGGIFFGLALIISYPIVWANLIFLPVLILKIVDLPKKFGRAIVLAILGSQVRKLLAQNDVRIVAVAGSVGKTSTKFAVAELLEGKLKVRWQKGNYNDPVSVPLVIFGHTLPGLFNIWAWAQIFASNRRQISNFGYDVVVLELGTDHTGTLAQFGKYLKVDVGILTAIAPEHMEYFETLDRVAAEELALANFSRELLVNVDLCAEKYHPKKYTSYGFGESDYQVQNYKRSGLKQVFDIVKSNKTKIAANVDLLSKNQIYGAVAAAAVAEKLGFDVPETEQALRHIVPAEGRLNPLAGVLGSTILDDTYNSAPEAAVAALDTLYELKAPQKIAILGSMNELGDFSRQAHEQVGEYCDPKKLDLVVSVGADAKKWLAPAAKNAGCKVESFDDPVSAGKFVRKKLKSKALILAKGSQNGVFLEEAVKLLLADNTDEKSLVRQSKYWLSVKKDLFSL